MSHEQPNENLVELTTETAEHEQERRANERCLSSFQQIASEQFELYPENVYDDEGVDRVGFSLPKRGLVDLQRYVDGEFKVAVFDGKGNQTIFTKGEGIDSEPRLLATHQPEQKLRWGRKGELPTMKGRPPQSRFAELRDVSDLQKALLEGKPLPPE